MIMLDIMFCGLWFVWHNTAPMVVASFGITEVNLLLALVIYILMTIFNMPNYVQAIYDGLLFCRQLDFNNFVLEMVFIQAYCMICNYEEEHWIVRIYCDAIGQYWTMLQGYTLSIENKIELLIAWRRKLTSLQVGWIFLDIMTFLCVSASVFF